MARVCALVRRAAGKKCFAGVGPISRTVSVECIWPSTSPVCFESVEDDYAIPLDIAL